MNEEKKYEIVGKVEIGTDEYRDLVTKNATLLADYERERDKRWEIERNIDSLNKNVETLSQYKEYVVEKCHDAYRLWLIEKQQSEDEVF